MSAPRTALLALLACSCSALAAAQSSPAPLDPSGSPTITVRTQNPDGQSSVKTFKLSPAQQSTLLRAMDHPTCYYLRTYKFAPQSPGSAMLKPEGETVCQPSNLSHTENTVSHPSLIQVNPKLP